MDGIIRRLADNRSAASWATKMRRERFTMFLKLLSGVPRPLRILDVGGTQLFWSNMAFGDSMVEVVLLNRLALEVNQPGYISVAGDARALDGFKDGEFEVVFSNSVIEHLGDLPSQRAMASEVSRVGQRYWIQTPNRYFPIEAHSLVPLYQFLPRSSQASLAERFQPGWYRGIPPQEAKREAGMVRLLTARELKSLFPSCTIWRERTLGLIKSLVAYKGFNEQAEPATRSNP
jgi:hypothetical protein